MRLFVSGYIVSVYVLRKLFVFCGDPFQSGSNKPKDESERNVCLQRAPFALRS